MIRSTPRGIKNYEGGWSIYSNSRRSDWFEKKFDEKISKGIDICNYNIVCHMGDEAQLQGLIGFQVSVPEKIFKHYFSIWENIICTNSKVPYLITFDFMGFPASETTKVD